MKNDKRKSELLIPAGSYDKLKTAIMYGADAVYAGLPDLSLRKQAKFSLEELKEAIKLVHEAGKRIYLTLNLFTHNRDVPKLNTFLSTLRSVNPDGLIIADPGVFQFVKQHAPEIPLHVSTQANVCSWLTVKYWVDQGAAMCVLGREVSFPELKEIKQKCPDIKLEAFVHGSMCMSYSGRCLISNFLTERSSNQGNCVQSCRWKYNVRARMKQPFDDAIPESARKVMINSENREAFEFFLEDPSREGELFEIEDTQYGAYILNSKDLCLMPKLDQILELGIDSLKIEGRNKTEFYAASVARAYRYAIDAWYEDPANWNYQPYMEELEKISHRGYTFAFFDGHLTHHANNYETTRSYSDYKYLGVVKNWAGSQDSKFLTLELKNNIELGDEIEFLTPMRFEPIKIKLDTIIDADTDTKVDRLTAGNGHMIKLPISQFSQSLSQAELNKIEAFIPILSVARKKFY
jgi:putative protease